MKIDYYQKYLKYKNKYLELKGGKMEILDSIKDEEIYDENVRQFNDNINKTSFHKLINLIE
jgi:hypothetical protein